MEQKAELELKRKKHNVKKQNQGNPLYPDMTTGSTKLIMAFGNPLLDTIVMIKDDALLTKYNLENDGQKEVSESDMKLLQNDIINYEKAQMAGGSAQNTLRTLQWLLNKQITATMIGSVGHDENGAKLRTLLENDGVTTIYVEKDLPTGTTVSLVNGPNRSLVAYLGAAEILQLTDLQDVPIKAANLVYIEGFFLTRRLKVAKFIADLCLQHKICLAFNISAKYLCEQYSEDVLYFAEKSDILFGSKTEFESLTSLNPLQLSRDKPGKLIVITDGHRPIKLVHDGCLEEIQVPQLNAIKDTTGAGDAFVAGFLAGLFRGCQLTFCCNLGCYAAQEIIQREGCAIPEFAPRFQF